MIVSVVPLLFFVGRFSFVLSGNPTNCDVPNSGVDLFPVKAKPVHSKYWDVQYYNTYKIVRNLKLNQTYLLFQCGTEVPSSVSLSDYSAVVSIPLNVVGLTQTPMITFMEQIGARSKIGAFLSDPSFIWSPCFAKDVAQGSVALANKSKSSDGVTTVTFVGNNPSLSDMVVFAQDYESTAPLTNVIKVSESSETTNAAIFEWVVFFSLFFNKEEEALKVTQAATDRFQCVQTKTSLTRSDSQTKPKLLWGYYSDYCGGWDVGECPNYYCEFAEACSVEILSSSQGSNQEAAAKCGAVYMTTEEFISFGKDADYWFFPASNFEATWQLFQNELAAFKSVQNKQVFDYQGLGKNSWFEQRYAEYYNVLEDMCVTVGTRRTDSLFAQRHFWRNVLTEQVPADGIKAECTNKTAANILYDVHECGPNFGNAVGENENPAAPSWSAHERRLAAVTAAAVALVTFFLLLD